MDLIAIPVNAFVMYWIKTKNRTLVDSMVLLDCVANIGALISLFLMFPKRIWGSTPYCMFTLGCKTFFLHMNKVIPVTVAIYRFILVCRREDSETFGKGKGAQPSTKLQ